jgi:hypothetical protein
VQAHHRRITVSKLFAPLGLDVVRYRFVICMQEVWWFFGPLRRGRRVGAYGRAMGVTTSKVEARKAARRAQAAAQAAAAERARLNVEDLATFFTEQGRASAVDVWLAGQEAKLRLAADRRRASHRRAAGLALRAIRERGESVKSVAALAGVSENLVRGLIREAVSVGPSTPAPDLSGQYT